LALDIVDFHELLARQPELARAIREEARKRLGTDIGPPRPELTVEEAIDRAMDGSD
jgi:hypothetical protein